MENCYNILSNIGIFNLVLGVLTILGFWLSYIGYLRARRVELPRYATRSSNIINKSTSFTTSAITVSAGNKPIDTLTITKLAFWNAGKITLDKKNVAKKDPFVIKCAPGTEIIDYEVQLKEKANDVNLKLSPRKDRINVCFDYFAYKQGFVLKIYHTGESSTDISLEGSIKSGHEIKRFTSNTAFCYSNKAYIEKFSPKEKETNNNLESERRSLGWATMLGSFLLLILYIVLIIRPTTTPTHRPDNNILGIVMVAIMSLTLLALGIFLVKKRMPKEISKIFYNDK